MIELIGLTKKFGDLTAVDHLNLAVPPGEIYAFTGPNGAGKTTTIKMIAGLLRPTEGSVRLCGLDVRKDAIAAKSLLSYVPDEPYLYDKLTGREFLEFVGSMYGLAREEIQRRTGELMERFALGAFIDDLAETYSHGMKQRVVISAALLHDPKVIVVDEPLVGLDPKGASILKQVFRERAARGAAIFVSTHTLALAEEIADRVGILRKGRLIAEGLPRQIREMARTGGRLEEAFLLLTEEERAGGAAPAEGRDAQE
jgi:ABC-2 type transport system ATP-binding protein